MLLRLCLTALLVVSALASSPSVLAAPPPSKDEGLEKAKALFTHAEALYTLQKYDEALAEYEKAFELKPLPGFLFNIAQCHRQLNHYDKAAHFYRSYLEKSPKAPNRDMVLGFIDEMDTKLKSEPQQPPPTVTPPPVAPPKPEDRVGIVPLEQPPPPPPPSTPVYKKWWLWTAVGAVVVVGAAVGIGAAAASSGGPHSTLGTIDATH